MARILLDRVSLTFRVRQHSRITLKEYLVRRMFRPSVNPYREVRALQDMPTQGRRAAGRQVVQGAPLLGRQARTIPLQERVATAPDHLGHLEPRPGHGRVGPPAGTSSPSNGLRVDCSAAVVTWR